MRRIRSGGGPAIGTESSRSGHRHARICGIASLLVGGGPGALIRRARLTLLTVRGKYGRSMPRRTRTLAIHTDASRSPDGAVSTEQRIRLSAPLVEPTLGGAQELGGAYW